jgi:hypothetical protein
VVEHLSSKLKALSSNSSTAKKQQQSVVQSIAKMGRSANYANFHNRRRYTDHMEQRGYRGTII